MNYTKRKNTEEKIEELFKKKLNASGKWRTDEPDSMYDAYVVLYKEEHPFLPSFDRIKVLALYEYVVDNLKNR